MMVILDLHIADLCQRLEELGYRLTISKEVKSLIIDNGTDERYGARILQRTLQKMVEDRISEVILKERPPKGKLFKLDLKKGTTDQIEVLIRSK
jgi:ATP-dependent Clp protease ATP-binding subunit ClpC